MNNSRRNFDDKTFSVLVNNAGWGSAPPRIWSLWLLKISTRTLHENLDLLTARWFWTGYYYSYSWGNRNHQEEACNFWPHTLVSVASLSDICLGRWTYFGTSPINRYEIRPFIQNTLLLLLDFQPQSDALCWSLAWQWHASDIHVPDNKPLLWSLQFPQEVRACGLSAPVKWTRIYSDKTVT